MKLINHDRRLRLKKRNTKIDQSYLTTSLFKCYDVALASLKCIFWKKNTLNSLGNLSRLNYRILYLSLILSGTSFFGTSVTAQDTDGDGVLDIFDIDDDNDGALDADERNMCRTTEWVTFGQWTMNNGAVHSPTAVHTDATIGNQTPGPGWDYWSIPYSVLQLHSSSFPQSEAEAIANGFYLEYTITPGSGKAFDVLGLYWGWNDFDNFPKHDYKVSIYVDSDNFTTPIVQDQSRPNDFENYIPQPINVSEPFLYDLTGSITLRIYLYEPTYGVGGNPIFNGHLLWDDFGISGYHQALADCDNDGIPNIQDSDSDNDGCSDLYGSYLQAVAAGVDPNPTGSSSPSIGPNGELLGLTFSNEFSFDKLNGIGLDDVSDSWAAAWADYDNDGFVDLLVTNNELDVPNFLYHNDGDGTFTKVTSGPIATDAASSLGASWGDYNNDGFLDLFVANNIGQQNFLYRNEGGGSFTKILSDPIVTNLGYAHGASWVDYDNDGFLDLFVTEYFPTRFNHLYHNNGDGTFTEATSSLPSLEAANSVTATWGDYNNDNLPDLFVANANEENNSLYKNLGNGNFLKVTSGSIVTDGGSSVGASWGDYDNDGDLDLFVSNSGNQDNFLYQNNGNETFTRIITGSIVNDGGHSHGSIWADVDFDGDIDLFVSNDQNQSNFLYVNNGDGTFDRLENELTQDLGDSFGAALADINNDGNLEFFVANHNLNENHIYRSNPSSCFSSACISLEGTNSNSAAIGSKIYIKANIFGEEKWQMREISSQTGGGIGGQNELKTTFGIGDAMMIDSLIVHWNSGYREVLIDVDPTDCIVIKEGNASIVRGTLYFDENENCIQDPGEGPVTGMHLNIQPGNYTVISDSNGDYSISLPPGPYTIEEVYSGTNWEPNCSAQQTVIVEGINNEFTGFDFPNKALCGDPDLQVEISSTPHRVGFQNLIAVTYRNTGGMTATDVKLLVKFDEDTQPLEASVPWDVENGVNRIWEIGDVPMGASSTIYIIDSVAVTTPIGKDIVLKAEIDGKEKDCNKDNDKVTDTQPAVGAVDPNDILVNPAGYIANDQELIYKIRFQNVGNAEVSTVRIENRLPSNLDINTLKLGIASHTYRFEVGEDNRLTWIFENINMPDSLTNEPESHGFVIYKVLPKKDLLTGTSIENKASIFFDNTNPLVTNTVVNIIGYPFGSSVETGLLNIVPNPMSDFTIININTVEGTNVPIQSVFVYDLIGRELYSKVSSGLNDFQMDREKLEAGYYLIRAIGVDGIEYTGKVIITD